MTETDTVAVPKVHWNFFLGFLAALIALAVGCVGAFATRAWVQAWGNPVFGAGPFGLGKFPFCLASLVYPALFVTQVVFTVRLFQHEAEARVYKPAVVGSAAVAFAATVMVMVLFNVYIYTFGG